MTISIFFIMSALVFQVLALQKIIILGMPLYFLELCILGAVAGSFWSFDWKIKNVEKKIRDQDALIILGVIAIFSGAIFSTFGAASLSLTSLGQLKSWFFFPMLYFILGICTLSPSSRIQLYKGWFVGTVLIALGALFGILKGYSTYDQRLAFPYTSPNFLAYLILPGMILGVYFLWNLKMKQERFWSLFCLLALILQSYILFETQSYNVWMSCILTFLFGAALFLIVGKVDNKRRYWIGTLLFGICIVGSLYFVVRNESKWQNLFKQDGRSALDSRFMIWETATSLIKDNPIIGIGVGNFQREYLSYQDQFPLYIEWAVPEPHNIFLALWLQTGIIGFLGFLLLVTRFCILIYSKINKTNSQEIKKEGILLLMLLFSFFVYGLLDTPYFRNDLAFLFWTLMLLGVLYLSDNTNEQA